MTAPRAITDAQIAAVEWVDESGVPVCLHCRRVKSFFGHWGHTDDCPLAPLLEALRSAREPAGRELESAAIAVMRFSTPPDNLHNCYFCGRIPHGQGCAWMGLSNALDAALAALSTPTQTKGSE